MLNQLNRKPFRSKVKPLSLFISTAMSFSFSLIISQSTLIYAEEFFDPSFLGDDISSPIASDLSRFNSGKQLSGIYTVDVYINSEFLSSKSINFVEKEGEDKSGLMPCFNLDDLKGFGINTDLYPELQQNSSKSCIDFLSIIPESTVNLQVNLQKLSLEIPQAYLNSRARDYISPEEWENGINAFYSNYYLSGNRFSQGNSQSLFLSLNNGLNIGSWQIHHNGVLGYQKNARSSKTNWNNSSIYAQRNIAPIKSKFTIGDVGTPGDIFDSISFRGIQLATSEAMFSDRQQGFAPVIRGTAKTNARVIIKQNGFTTHQENVSPGPFVINDMFAFGVTGDYEVTIEESDGSSTHFVVPYSSLAIFKRPGRFEYNLTAGEYRNGSMNSKGNPKFVQATVVGGLNNLFTIYGGTQIADSYSSGLLGVGGNLGNYGALSFDLTHANSKIIDDSKHSGQSLRFLYSKSLIRTGTSFQLLGYRYSTKGFFTFNDVANNRISNYEDYLRHETDPSYEWIMNHSLAHPKKGRLQANISHNFKDKGSLYFTGNQQTYWNTSERDEWLTLGYSNSWKALSYGLNFSHNKNSRSSESGDTSYGLTLSLPLSALFSNTQRSNPINTVYTSFNIAHSDNSGTQFRSSLSGTALKDRNLSYSITQNHTSSYNSNTASLNYSATYGQIGAGYSQIDSASQYMFNASGATMVHRNGITFGQSIYGGSILVKAPKAPGISIQNYNGVKTDWRGYAILPYAQAYRQNRIGLDMNTLPDNVEIDKSVDFVVPMEGAISRVTFDPRIGIRALITLTYKGQPLPYATQVTELNSQTTAMVADESRVFLSGLPLQGALKAQWGSNLEDSCLINYKIADNQISSGVTQLELNCD